MPSDAHRTTARELIQLGRLLDFSVYAADEVGETLDEFPGTIDQAEYVSARQIDVIWFGAGRLPKFAFEVEFSSGVDSGMHRLYQLRHFGGCQLVVVLQKGSENESAYTNRFRKLRSGDPFNVVADMYRLLDSSAVTQLHDKAISLAKAKYEALAMAPHPAMLHVIDKSTAYPEVPSWAVSGKQNWNVHFTVRRREARDLFIDLVERIRKAGPALEVRVNKYHISLYSGPTMAAVIYPRRDNLMFLMKNVEDQYDGTTLQKSKKPAGEPCIESASQFLIVYSRDEFDEAIRLLRLAAA